MSNNWQTVIGIEIHAQVNSKSKLFSSSSTGFGSAPNTQVSLVDAAMPGMLPVINKFCIEQAVKSGLGLNAKINSKSIFDRKNYFYQDLPQGYQISQFKDPIVGEGSIEIDIGDEKKVIGIERLHLEQDAGKSLHDQDPNLTFVDLNRSGIALMEIVSKPDMASPEEAVAYVKKVRTILRYLDTCDGNMEQGSLRADVNISVRKEGDELGTRCEIKNLNSFKHINAAINFEVDRQIKVIEGGDKIKQETRLYDVTLDKTRSMRSKEDAHDYRYFPDPDLLPLKLNQNWIDNLKKDLPELPDEKKARFVEQYKISDYDAEVLTSDRLTSEYFEKVAKNRNAKLAVSWVASELFAILNKLNLTIEKSPVNSDQLGDLIDEIENGIISNRAAKEVFEEMCESSKSVKEIINDKGLVQISDTTEIEKFIDQVLIENPDNVQKYKEGKTKLLGFFIGEVMKATKGKANPGLLNQIVKKKLDN
ncbi:Asp-tRNA(Asn)/Glu-tRNA(Gln) amidotransferase subunit GatB [Pelagibacterales bacterium]|nr:Asp-tRNA(Asn)/Glu-tRNA(Gln) amidotransferase subunit GatB [Pelagibacterales bacterium]MDB9818790.1 Asp-tRNA(Asn)/Glu-tRNA(Gln) amidotransferase subunit GatB [Pelagibacterales bacterium]|tara:strand:+ start:574 stop:2004 length:1431 start_codon:yes stop_codon:yes gene_type:complete